MQQRRQLGYRHLSLYFLLSGRMKEQGECQYQTVDAAPTLVRMGILLGDDLSQCMGHSV